MWDLTQQANNDEKLQLRANILKLKELHSKQAAKNSNLNDYEKDVVKWKQNENLLLKIFK